VRWHEAGPHLYATLAKVTYKAGWDFELISSAPTESWHLYIKAKVINVVTGDRSEIAARDIVPDLVYWSEFNEQAFLHWLRYRILQVETHEVNEWLRVDCVPLVDPHPPRPA
jgi:hypothetical protein